MPAKGQDKMQTSRYLARLIGPVALAMGAYVVLNGATFRLMAGQFLASYALIFLAGLLTLIAGIAIVLAHIAIVLAHNVWTRDWRVIITIFGWLAIVGGAVRIVFPELVASLGVAMLAQTGALLFIGLGIVILGAVLSYFGYRK